jgi:hypothetical protein
MRRGKRAHLADIVSPTDDATAGTAASANVPTDSTLFS